jgi:integrase
MRCPSALARQRAVTDKEFRLLLRAAKPDFRILLFALRKTGCRPKEARTLRWEMVLPDRWVLSEHKTAGKTHKPRIIYLSCSMRRLMTRLRRTASSSWVFTNRLGKAWTRNSIRLRMDRLRKKLKLPNDVTAYMLRHAFGTSAVMNGVDVATVAELMGHTDLQMVSRVYLHLRGQDAHLHQALDRATRPVAKLPSDAVRRVL